MVSLDEAKAFVPLNIAVLTISDTRSLGDDKSGTTLADRLTAAGVRPINAIVDVTNYVMIEIGQPLHAFDAATLAGSAIHVRRFRSRSGSFRPTPRCRVRPSRRRSPPGDRDPR